jgi:hypothetical protein
METSGEISFHGQEGHRMGFHHLMNTMDEHIRNHDRVLAQGVAQTDIGMGMSAAGWLAEAVFSSAVFITQHTVNARNRTPFRAFSRYA